MWELFIDYTAFCAMGTWSVPPTPHHFLLVLESFGLGFFWTHLLSSGFPDTSYHACLFIPGSINLVRGLWNYNWYTSSVSYLTKEEYDNPQTYRKHLENSHLCKTLQIYIYKEPKYSHNLGVLDNYNLVWKFFFF